ncbi:HAD-IIIA family hydrolase [Oceanobacillus sp. 1P07AA]|uniref:HAD-IIIA family hydrolase n=1 Tax=Oceanobacillus sp. 1P07AA TaxID=3132293 RepID=UPI0039A695FB
MMNKKLEAVFLDREGTIGGDDKVHYPGDFKMFEKSKENIDYLKKSVQVFSFTNQPGISFGEARKEDFYKELIGFGFDDVFICPHHHKEGCKCRKPNGGMLKDASNKYQLNLNNCIIIGDRWSDMVAASKTNSVKILVKTGAGTSTLHDHFEKLKGIEIDFVAENLTEAVNWIGYRYQFL